MADTTTAVEETTESEVITQEEPKDEVVSKKEFKKVLDEAMAYKKQLADEKAKSKDRDMAVLKQKEDWQQIAKLREQEAEAATQKTEKLEKAFINERKLSVVKAEAAKQGMRKEALDDIEMLPLDGVTVEVTSTGRINILGAEDEIARLKARKPHWFSSKTSIVNSNNVDVSLDTNRVTLKDLNDAQAKAKKSGDYAPYYKLHEKYRKQKQ